MQQWRRLLPTLLPSFLPIGRLSPCRKGCDDNLYRVVLQADPVSDAVRKAGYGGTNRYEQLRDMANEMCIRDR